MASFSSFSNSSSSKSTATGRHGEDAFSTDKSSSCRGSGETASVSSKGSSNSSSDSETAFDGNRSSPNSEFSVDLHYVDGPSRKASREPITSNYGAALSNGVIGSAIAASSLYSSFNDHNNTGRDAVTKNHFDTSSSCVTDDVVSPLRRGESTKEVNVAARIHQFSGTGTAPSSLPPSQPPLNTQSWNDGGHGADLLKDLDTLEDLSTPPLPSSSEGASCGFQRTRNLVSSRATGSRSGSLHSVLEEEEASEYSEDLRNEDTTLETAGQDSHDLISTDEECSYLEDSMTDMESIHTENPQFIAIGIVKDNDGEERAKQASSFTEKDPPIRSTNNAIYNGSEAVAEEIAREEHELKQQARSMNTTVDSIRRRSAPSILAAQHSVSEGSSESKTNRGLSGSSFSETGDTTLKNAPAEVAETAPPVRNNIPSYVDSTRATAAHGTCGMNEMDRDAKLRAMHGATGPSNQRPPAIVQRGRTNSSESTSQPLVPARNTSIPSSMHTSGQRVPSGAPNGSASNRKTVEEAKINEDEVSVCPSLHTIQSNSSGITLDEKTTERIARSAPLRARRPVRTTSRDERSSDTTTSEADMKMSATASSHMRDDKRNMRISSSTSQSSNNTTARSTRPSDEKAAYRRQLNESADAMVARVPARMPSVSDHSSSRDNSDAEQELPFQSIIAEVSTGDNTEDLEAQAGVPVILPGAFAVGGIEDEGEGYDSGYDDANSVTGGVEVVDEQEECAPLGIQRGSVCGSVDTSSPLQAELYEVGSFVDAEVLVEEEEEKVVRRSCLVQVFCAIFVILAVAGIVMGVVLPRISKNGSNVKTPEGEKVIEVQGWKQIGDLLVGPTYKDNIRFGNSVAVSGDGTRMAVGLPGADKDGQNILKSAGSVLIYDLLNGTTWEESFQIDGLFANAESGTRVALSEDGTRVAIGATAFASNKGGYVAIYQESNFTGDWDLIGDIITTDEDIAEVFGGSIAFSSDGDIVAIGDKYSDRATDGAEDTGLLRLFREVNNTWVQMGDDLFGAVPRGRFGWAIDMSGDGTRVAATSLGTNDIPGSVQVFDFDGDSWQEIGSQLIGESPRETFGASIAMSSDGNRLATAATSYSRGGKEAGVGVVRSYEFDEAQQDWEPLGEPLEGTNQFDAFGSSVYLSDTGDIIAIGGPKNQDFCEDCGHIQVFKNVDGEWQQLGTAIGKDKSEGGQFGFALAMSSDGTRVVGAAPFTTFDGFVSKVGQALMYEVDEQDAASEDEEGIDRRY